jgi:hypothetical protein
LQLGFNLPLEVGYNDAMSEPSKPGPNDRKCPCCGGAEFIDGTAAGFMPLQFRPKGTGHFSSGIPLKLLQCSACGNVQFFASVKTAQRATQPIIPRE